MGLMLASAAAVGSVVSLDTPLPWQPVLMLGAVLVSTAPGGEIRPWQAQAPHPATQSAGGGTVIGAALAGVTALVRLPPAVSFGRDRVLRKQPGSQAGA